MKRIILLLIVVIYSNISAQNCTPTNQWEWKSQSNWYFGEALLGSFAGGSFIVDPLSYNLANDKRAYEGVSSISDDLGNLQYYTNGRNLFDAQHNLISSGLLSGNEWGGAGSRSSSVQGVLMVRHPETPELIYIFTADDALSFTASGLNYWTLNAKTKVLSTPKRIGNFRTSEQLIAAFHSNGKDIWICVREAGSLSTHRNLHSFLITNTGVNETAKTTVLNGLAGNYDSSVERGTMKISWDGKKAALVNSVSWEDYDKAIIILDFDNSTGYFSNEKDVSANWGGFAWNGSTYGNNYSCEFSPDSKSLYVTTLNTSNLLWLDVTKVNSNDIYNTIKIASNQAAAACSVKLGNDGKLYQTTSTNEIAVFSGDLNDGVNFVRNTIPFNSRNSYLGLPNVFAPAMSPVEINNPGNICLLGGTRNLSAQFTCFNSNAEDALNNPNGWTGQGIVDAANGIFDPAIAGLGITRVYFQRANQKDSMDITITNCQNNTSTRIITGNVFEDKNQNQVKDLGEKNIKNAFVYLSSSEEYYGVETDSLGNYYLQITDTNLVDVKIDQPATLGVSKPSNLGYYTLKVSTSVDTVFQKDFGLYTLPNKFDLSTDLFACNAIINQSTGVKLLIKNNSVDPIHNVQCSFQFQDDVLSFISSSNSLNQNGNILTLSLDSLKSFASFSTCVKFGVTSDVSKLGTSIVYSLGCTIQEQEDDLQNNPSTIQRIIRGPYDPNFKESTLGNGDIDEKTNEMVYTIHFQNTGNDTAYNVSVKDSLDLTVFDISNFQSISSSHKHAVSINKNGLLEFKFENIYLPDSTTDYAGSNGYVKFKIALKSGLLKGKSFKNRAFIFFDSNPPVITDYAFNTLNGTTKVEEFQINNNSIFPNPTSGLINITINPNQDLLLKVFDIQGREVYQEMLSSSQTQLNLPSGLYFVQVGNDVTKLIVHPE